jgi:putative salt-induced outer membrane protein YdiY
MLPLRRILVCLMLPALCCAGHLTHGHEAGEPSVFAPPSAQVSAPPLFELPDPTAAQPPSVLEEALSDETVALGPEHELVPPIEVYEWYETSYWFGPAPWDMGLNFGINGSEGQNRSQSIQAGAYVKRDAELWTLDSKISYNLTSANSIETQNNAMLDARVDRKLNKSAWSLFVLNQTQYDEFQPFDLRVAINSGVGYKWVDTENFNLLGRFGGGASREFGGPDDEWAAEALFGLDYEYLISDKQRLTAKVDYFPEWQDFGNYRVVSDVGWEIDLDKPKNMSLRVTVNDRYDSTPNGVDPNLVNYAVLLNWKL